MYLNAVKNWKFVQAFDRVPGKSAKLNVGWGQSYTFLKPKTQLNIVKQKFETRLFLLNITLGEVVSCL